MSTEILIVDETDKVIGSVPRDKRPEGSIIRVARAWVFNSKEEVLIAQRSFDKKYSAGRWGPSAAGTVEKGETYESNIVKELKEEINLSITEKDLIPGYHRLVHTEHRYFSKGFFVKSDLPIAAFSPQKSEVEAVRWIPIDELVAMVKENPADFIQSMGTKESSLNDCARFLKSQVLDSKA